VSSDPARSDPGLLEAVLALAAQRHGQGGRLTVLGICGAQGSGKSTLAAAVVARLAAEGTRAATLSLDDLYLTRAERQDLAARVHPLFATRGVPGTHDPALGIALIDRLARGEDCLLPRFDKASDDRLPPALWPASGPALDVLVLEGWCLGARPQPEAELAEPVNPLERDEDPDGTWRGAVNQALAGPYQDLFAPIDALVLLAAPGFEVVEGWRRQQEADLGPRAAMDGAAIARFVRFYERLTRHILAEMPHRADLVARLGPDRQVLSLRPGTPSHQP
jgi:D-glycerate 3-kinase